MALTFRRGRFSLMGLQHSRSFYTHPSKPLLLSLCSWERRERRKMRKGEDRWDMKQEDQLWVCVSVCLAKNYTWNKCKEVERDSVPKPQKSIQKEELQWMCEFEFFTAERVKRRFINYTTLSCVQLQNFNISFFHFSTENSLLLSLVSSSYIPAAIRGQSFIG